MSNFNMRVSVMTSSNQSSVSLLKSDKTYKDCNYDILLVDILSILHFCLREQL